MASQIYLQPGDETYISSESCIHNGLGLYGQAITILKVFDFNGKSVAEVRFHDQSIPIKYIYCKHIARPEGAASRI